MLAVIGVVVAGLTLLLIEGSLVYYRSPAAPRRLRDDLSLQATLSSSLTIGIVGAIFLVGQFLASSQVQHFGLIEAALIAAALVAFVVAWRWLRGVKRNLGISNTPMTVEDDENGSRVVPLPQGSSTPPETPRPVKGSGGRKAA